MTDMSNMFYNASAFTSDLSEWETGNVTKVAVASFVAGVVIGFQLRGSLRKWIKRLNL